MIICLLLVTLVKICNEKEQSNQEKKIQGAEQFEEKRSTRKWNGVKARVEGDNVD